MQAKHITEEPDVGNEVPAFLQNSLSSPQGPPPSPQPPGSEKGRIWGRMWREGGNSTFGASKSKKNPFGSCEVEATL